MWPALNKFCPLTWPLCGALDQCRDWNSQRVRDFVVYVPLVPRRALQYWSEQMRNGVKTSDLHASSHPAAVLVASPLKCLYPPPLSGRPLLCGPLARWAGLSLHFSCFLIHLQTPTDLMWFFYAHYWRTLRVSGETLSDVAPACMSVLPLLDLAICSDPRLLLPGTLCVPDLWS